MSMRNNSSMRSSLAPSQHKSRQLAHLHSQLAQLQAHLSDLDNHIRVTSIQAEAIRRLGGLQAGLLYNDLHYLLIDSVAASQVLGEESANRSNAS